METEQRTAEWFEMRRGKVTSSAVKNVSMKTSTAGYRNYRAQLVAERLSGQVAETFCSFDMQRGIDLEDDARACYQFESGNTVEQVAFITHPRLVSGSSPDGLVDEEGQIEIKCPKVATHIDYLMDGVVPKVYQPQMQHQMACSGRKWNDFVSYCPELPEDLQLFICRLERNEEEIAAMELAIETFETDVQDMISKLETIRNK